MEECRYVAVDYDLLEPLPQKDFGSLREAIDYAKDGNKSAIWKCPIVNGEFGNSREDRIVWRAGQGADNWPKPEKLWSDGPLFEDYSVTVNEDGKNVTVNGSDEETTKEVAEFARAILGDNWEYFDCDYAECGEAPENAPIDGNIPDNVPDRISFHPEFDVDFPEVSDYDDGAKPIEEPLPAGVEPVEEEPKAEPEADGPVPEDEAPVEAAPRDMINGKLVAAKDPDKAEIDVDEEVEEDDEDDEEFKEEFGKKVASRKGQKLEEDAVDGVDWDSMSEEEFLQAFGKMIKADLAKMGR